MSGIIHLSDLHFGTESVDRVEALVPRVQQHAPALVVVSGDLTQRARSSEFAAAAGFLQRLPGPQLIVPGNHDVPLYDLVRRFLLPLARYRRHIAPQPNPWFQSPALAVLGLNTTRSFTWKRGRISWEQIDLIRARFCALPEGCFRVLVTHHPFIPPPTEPEFGIDLVGRARQALKVLDECKVDLLLAGHLHHGYIGDVRTYYPATRRSIVVAQAGTAISRRVRQQPNGYNHIALDQDRLLIRTHAWSKGGFHEAESVAYRLVDQEWRRER